MYRSEIFAQNISTPALQQAGWNSETKVREEVTFTEGKIDVRGNLTSRGKKKRANYILYDMASNTGKSTSMNNITRGLLVNLPISIPSIDEQKSIVTKVEHVGTYCAQ